MCFCFIGQCVGWIRVCDYLLELHLWVCFHWQALSEINLERRAHSLPRSVERSSRQMEFYRVWNTLLIFLSKLLRSYQSLKVVTSVLRAALRANRLSCKVFMGWLWNLGGVTELEVINNIWSPWIYNLLVQYKRELWKRKINGWARLRTRREGFYFVSSFISLLSGAGANDSRVTFVRPGRLGCSSPSVFTFVSGLWQDYTEVMCSSVLSSHVEDDKHSYQRMPVLLGLRNMVW